MIPCQTLHVERTGHCVHIRLNRPNEANAVNRLMAAELARTAHACEADPQVRAVVLTGTGRFFCAGGDIQAMASHGNAVASEIKLLVEDFHQAISSFARMQAPLITAVNGPAAGAGLSLAIAGDLVIAAEGATFTSAYTAVGLSPDGSSTYYLPRLIGLRRTQELMLTNRRLSADEAVQWGLATEAVASDRLLPRAHALADALCNGSVASHGHVKRLLLGTFDNGLETQMALEARAIAAAVGSDDGREGVSAFLGKRKPKFSP